MRPRHSSRIPGRTPTTSRPDRTHELALEMIHRELLQRALMAIPGIVHRHVHQCPPAARRKPQQPGLPAKSVTSSTNVWARSDASVAWFCRAGSYRMILARNQPLPPSTHFCRSRPCRLGPAGVVRRAVFVVGKLVRILVRTRGGLAPSYSGDWRLEPIPFARSRMQDSAFWPRARTFCRNHLLQSSAESGPRRSAAVNSATVAPRQAEKLVERDNVSHFGTIGVRRCSDLPALRLVRHDAACCSSGRVGS